eukprot:TRINITY_DN15258_c0_g1_i2.p1 TRINITY_DN15258_c0_g1~~TRINITY_DN15258_c0_g1_i2.p1  ORF type:complete len:243 (-),score=65.08 TRINITY_DN15258_c0_g1_i2:85-813(-)
MTYFFGSKPAPKGEFDHLLERLADIEERLENRTRETVSQGSGFLNNLFQKTARPVRKLIEEVDDVEEDIDEDLKDEVHELQRNRGDAERKISRMERTIKTLISEQDKLRSQWESASDDYENRIRELNSENRSLVSKLRTYDQRQEAIVRREVQRALDRERSRIDDEVGPRMYRERRDFDDDAPPRREEAPRKNVSRGWKREVGGWIGGNSLIVLILILFYYIYLSVKGHHRTSKTSSVPVET